MKLLLFFLQCIVISVGMPLETRAQFSLLKDVYPGPVSGIEPPFFIFKNKMYFSAADDVYGYELWAYDGINEPYMAYDLLPGSPTSGSRPAHFAICKDTLYFSAFVDLTQSSTAIRKYDGANPPVIAPYGAVAWVDQLIGFQDLLFFQGYDEDHGYELWTYDGVHAPHLLKDINPGAGHSLHYSSTIFNNKLYFIANDGTHGYELWVYDGVNEPSMVYDITPDPNAYPSTSELIIFNDKLYFSASTPDYGNELWMYDGINDPLRISDINPGVDDSAPGFLTVYQSKLYFNARTSGLNNELWVYNGMDDPALVKDIYPGNNGSGPNYLTVYHNKLYFTASIPDQWQEVWVYDGMEDPVQLSSISPDPAQSASAIFYRVFNDKLYFLADDNISGEELWVYDDGIVTATQQVNEIFSSLSVYPNPSHAAFTIQGKTEGNYYLYDGTGKEVLTVHLNTANNYRVTIDHLRAGLYTLKGFTTKETVYQKIVVIN